MLLKDCKKYFGTENLYEVLNVDSKSSAAAVKKAYYKQSMKWHPDRFSSEDSDESDKSMATTKFQVLSKVYNILSEKEKRALYDETGAVDEENILSGEAGDDAVNMWRQIFKKVTVEDIEKFINEYKDSPDERQDIKNSYEKRKGDMNLIMDDVIGANHEEEDRIKGIILELIDAGELKSTKKFKDSTSKKSTMKRKRDAQDEAVEAEEALKEIKNKEGGGDLQSLILARQAQRGQQMNSLFDSLAEKYAQPKKKKSAKGK